MRWEYKTLKVDTFGFTGGKFEISAFDRELNDHGRNGWELVSVFDTNMSGGVSRHVVATLKRPLESHG